MFGEYPQRVLGIPETGLQGSHSESEGCPRHVLRVPAASFGVVRIKVVGLVSARNILDYRCGCDFFSRRFGSLGAGLDTPRQQ